MTVVSVSEGIPHPIFYGDLLYKLRRIKCEANFVSSGSKIVKRLRRRKYDQVIIEMAMDLVFGPSTALYSTVLTPTNKAVGNIYEGLVQISQRRQGPDRRHLWLLARTYESPDQSLFPDGRSLAYSGGCLYIFLIYCCYHLTCLCNYFMASPLWLAVCPRSLLWGGLFTNFRYVSFRLHNFCG